MKYGIRYFVRPHICESSTCQGAIGTMRYSLAGHEGLVVVCSQRRQGNPWRRRVSGEREELPVLVVVRERLEFSHNGETGRERILRTLEMENWIVLVNSVGFDFLPFF